MENGRNSIDIYIWPQNACGAQSIQDIKYGLSGANKGQTWASSSWGWGWRQPLLCSALRRGGRGCTGLKGNELRKWKRAPPSASEASAFARSCELKARYYRLYNTTDGKGLTLFGSYNYQLIKWSTLTLQNTGLVVFCKISLWCSILNGTKDFKATFCCLQVFLLFFYNKF